MTEYALTGAKIITPYMEIKNGTLLISENKILAVGRGENVVIPEGMKRIDVSGLTMLPGFIDIHTHGSLGASASDSLEGIRKIYEYLPSTGITSWLPTILDERGINVIVSAIKDQESGSKILGIHMEGPFLTPKNIPGSPYEEPRYPNMKEYEGMLKQSEGNIRIMGLSPELDGAIPVVREMRRTGVVAAAAHSKATYEQLMAGVDAGIQHITHAFNVMTGFHHRKPGVVGGALVCDALTAEMIADGYHVSPVAMEMLLRCKGIEKVALISDNTRYAGLEDGIYENVEVKDGVVRRIGYTEETDGTMAGSVWSLDNNIRTIKRHLGRSLKEISIMASCVPAKVAGVYQNKGSLEPGKDADITLIDADWNVVSCIIGGKLSYQDYSWKSEVRSQRSEVRGWKSEVGSQRLEDR